MTKIALLRLTASLFLALAGSALAQIDARSQALLDGLTQAQQGDAVQTLDQTMVMTIYSDGSETVTSTRTVIDYANRRAVIFSDIGGGMLVRLVHVDGVTTMHMDGMPMAMPALPGMGDMFDSIFDPAQTLSDDPNAKAVYDGQVSYGDIVSGQQVTYTASYPELGTDAEVVTRFIFDGSDAYIAQVMEGTDGSVTIMVFDPPTTDDLYVARGSTMYDFRGGVGTLTARTQFQDVAVNQPLDESLFE